MIEQQTAIDPLIAEPGPENYFCERCEDRGYVCELEMGPDGRYYSKMEKCGCGQ